MNLGVYERIKAVLQSCLNVIQLIFLQVSPPLNKMTVFSGLNILDNISKQSNKQKDHFQKNYRILTHNSGINVASSYFRNIITYERCSRNRKYSSGLDRMSGTSSPLTAQKMSENLTGEMQRVLNLMQI